MQQWYNIEKNGYRHRKDQEISNENHCLQNFVCRYWRRYKHRKSAIFGEFCNFFRKENLKLKKADVAVLNIFLKFQKKFSTTPGTCADKIPHRPDWKKNVDFFEPTYCTVSAAVEGGLIGRLRP